MSSGEGRPPKGPDRRWPLVAAGTALALMVLIIVTTANREPILHSPDRDPDIHLRYGSYTPPTISAFGSAGTNEASEHAASTFADVMLDIMLVILLVVLIALIVSVAMSIVRRWRHRVRVQHEGPLPDVDDAVLDAVGEATRRQQQLLHEGAPSNAIVACWVDLEQAVAVAGVHREPSETSAELTLRVLDALEVDRRALRTLGQLYREARFSVHPLAEEDRQAAVDALDALHRSLPRTTQEQQV